MLSKSTYLSRTEIHTELPVFYQPWYMDMFGIDWDVWLYECDNFNVFFPFFKEKKLFFLLSRPMAPFMPYYGPYFISNKKISEIELKKVFTLLLKEISTFSEIYLFPHFSFSIKFLSEWNFKEKNMVTHILNLQKSDEELWDGLDYMRRKNIKKADKELRLVENEFDVELYFEWIKETYKRRGKKTLHNVEYYINFCEKTIQQNAAIFNTLYDKDNNPIAMSFCIKDKNTAYSILGANNPTIKNSAATTALLWKAILSAKNSGCKYFDFEGSNIDTIADYFRKFGSERIDYSGWHQMNSILWKLKNKWR